LKTAQDDRDNTRHSRRGSDTSDTERLVTKFRTEIEYLIVDLYYNWLKELKRAVGRIAVVAVVEHQGLPGFMDSSAGSGGFLNRLMGGGSSTASVSIEKLLSWLSKLNSTMVANYVQDSIR
jgi:hypothetical protein